MLAVTVGIVVQTSQDSWTSPNAMFIIVITAIFVLAGLLHPEEFMCLMPGVLYFLCIPSGELYNRVAYSRVIYRSSDSHSYYENGNSVETDVLLVKGVNVSFLWTDQHVKGPISVIEDSVK